MLRSVQDGVPRLNEQAVFVSMEQSLFHVMLEEKRVVILSMNREGAYTVYSPGGDVDEAWPRYRRYESFLALWFSERVGRPLSSPFSDSEVGPGSPEYPRILALILTHDPALSFWAYTTTLDILVSLPQVTRALGARRGGKVEEILRDNDVRFRNGGRGRCISLSAISDSLGPEVANQIVLYAGQVANFLGVQPASVSHIVNRLGIGMPGRSRVGVRWGTLRRVQRTGPRSFEVRNA